MSFDVRIHALSSRKAERRAVISFDSSGTLTETAEFFEIKRMLGAKNLSLIKVAVITSPVPCCTFCCPHIMRISTSICHR